MYQGGLIPLMEVYNIIILLFKNHIHTVQWLPDGCLKTNKILEFFIRSVFTSHSLCYFWGFFFHFLLMH